MEKIFGQLTKGGVDVHIHFLPSIYETSTNVKWRVSLTKTVNGAKIEVEKTDVNAHIALESAYKGLKKTLNAIGFHLGADDETLSIEHPIQ